MADLAKEWATATPIDLEKEWESATPLTAEWDAAAPAEVPMGPTFMVPPPGETQLSQNKPIRQMASDIYTPALEIGGFIGGAAVGAPGGLATGAVAAGGGYAIGKSAARRIDELTGLSEPQTLGEAATESVKDIASGTAIEMGGQVAGKYIIEPLVASAAQKLSKVIRGGIEKGIRPTVKGKSTAPEMELYLDRAESGVKSIISNKSNLQLTDKKGNIVTGKLPQSLKQFSESIDQTKKWVFDQYDELQKAAGATGVRIDLAPIVDDLLKLADNEVLRTEAPNIVRFARLKARQYAKQGTYTPGQAQEAIKTINERLRSAYAANDVKVTQTKSIEDFAVTRLRAGLDDVIEKSTGNASYQELKNAYGSLRSIEKDVAHRSIVDARKNKVGFFGYADIWTAAEVVAAITNPAHLPKAVAIQGTKRWIQWINNPNRIIKSMFGSAEKYMNRLPATVQEKVIASTPLKQVEKEVYRYNPEFKGTKSVLPKPLKTELQPRTDDIDLKYFDTMSESGYAENLKPNQLATVRSGKAKASKTLEAESKIGQPLSKPSTEKIKSGRPKTVEERLGKKIPMGKYKTPMDVREAFDRKKISGEEAELILTQKFGYEK